MATLGIDFGTSYTFIVKYDGKNFAVVGGDLYKEGSGAEVLHSKGIRTAIGKDNYGNWIVGWKINQALAKGDIEKNNICWDIKSKLRNLNKNYDFEKFGRVNGFSESYRPGINVPEDEHFGHFFVVGGKKEYKDALELAQKFFDIIFNWQRTDLSDVTCIVCGMPSDELNLNCPDSVAYRSMLKEQILGYINTDVLKLNLDENCLMTREEPILAGVSYFNQYPKTMVNGDVVLVVDIGGGTSDFALFEVQEKQIKRIDSKGNTSPAGNNFNEQIADSIANKLSVEIDSDFIKSDSFSSAKERLFLSRYAQDIEFWAKKTLNSIADMYAEYDDHGRRTLLKDGKNNKEYKIVYSMKHCEGISFDGYGSRWNNNDVIEIDDSFVKVYEKIAQKIKEFVESKKTKVFKNRINQVLFVGGSCRIPHLRDYVCAKALNLNRQDEAWSRSDGGHIDVFFLETESKAILTCSNAVAMGAAIEAYNTVHHKGASRDREITNTLTIPELWLKIEGIDTPFLLLSSDFKNNGEDRKMSKWGLSITFNRQDLDERLFVRFKIGRRIGDKNFERNEESMRYYPFRRQKKADGSISVKEQWFGYQLSELKEHDESTLVFFADITTSGDVALFVCRHNDWYKGSDRYKVNYRYIFIAKDGDARSKIVPTLQEFYCTNNNCKKYELMDKTEINEQVFKGKPFNASKYIKDKSADKENHNDNKWFGWIFTDKDN